LAAPRSAVLLITQDGTSPKHLEARTVVVPDITRFGIILSRGDQELLVVSAKASRRILKMIRKHRPERKVESKFTIEVPCLYHIAESLANDKQCILNLWATYDGLAKHFLPDATVESYSVKDIPDAGVRYIGIGWYSE
jgi:hypothetical protein